MYRIALSAMILLASTTLAVANVGPPATGGQVVGEPVGIRQIRIVGEKLIIDLRPVANSEHGKVTVEATYLLHNDGSQRSLDLLFASGSEDVSGFEAIFDGKTMRVSPAAGVTIPESWKPPKETPGFGDGRKMDYAPGVRGLNSVKVIGFTLSISPGPHTLTVRYAAAAGTNWLGQPTRFQQFAYVLAPARSWGGFGGLDVTVHLPKGWEAVVSPELERDGDTLRGSFPHLPSDALAITFRAPEGPWFRHMIAITQSILAVVGIAGLVAAWMVGRWRGRRRARAVVTGELHQQKIWPWALGIGMVWSLGFFTSGLLAVYGPQETLPEGQVGGYGYNQLFEAIGVGLLAPNVLVLGFLVAYVTGVIVLRRNLPAASEGPEGNVIVLPRSDQDG